MTNTEKYVAVEVHAFGHGMQTLFQGVAEVFSSMGIKAPDALEEQSKRWKPAKQEKGEANEDAEAESGADASDAHTDHTDVSAGDEAFAAVSEEEAAQKEMPEGPVEDTAEEPTDEKTEPAKKSRKKKETVTSSVTQDDITKIIVQKIKADRGNNEKIGQLLKSYGAVRVGDLPASKYEAFITDLAAI